MKKKVLEFLKEKKNKLAASISAFAVAVVMAVSGPVKEVGAAPVDFTGTTLPFTVPDMLATAVNFLTLYGEWVLIALGVIFAPVLYGLAMRLVSAAKARTATK